MAIVYKLDQDGGFTCGDTETRMTAYAFPTSPYAPAAKKRAKNVAAEMMAHGRDWVRFIPSDIENEFHSRNWARLEGPMGAKGQFDGS